MTFEITYGSESLPLPRHPNPFQMEYMVFGTDKRMKDLTLRRQFVGSRWRVRIFWEGLTSEERASLMQIYIQGMASSSTSTLTLVDGTSFTAMIAGRSWDESHYYSPYTGVVYYDVSITFEEA